MTSCKTTLELWGSAETVPELKKTLLFHVMSSEGNNFHSYCPVGADSWCQYQRDIVNKTNLYKPGAGIAPEGNKTHLCWLNKG